MEGSTLGMLSGTWRLVYSSGFASGSLGGLRPGPQAALLPITIGQVPPLQSCLDPSQSTDGDPRLQTPPCSPVQIPISQKQLSEGEMHGKRMAPQQLPRVGMVPLMEHDSVQL